MAERRVSIQIDIDLARGSKNGYYPTIERLSSNVGEYANQLFEAQGFNVRRAMTTTTVHYVRHVIVTAIKRPKRLKIVKASGQ